MLKMNDDCRGAGIVSRLATVAPERFLAYAFLAVPYVPPNPKPNFEQTLAMTKAMFGYELFGYWLFFAEDDTPKLVEQNVSPHCKMSISNALTKLFL